MQPEGALHDPAWLVNMRGRTRVDRPYPRLRQGGDLLQRTMPWVYRSPPAFFGGLGSPFERDYRCRCDEFQLGPVVGNGLRLRRVTL